MSYKDFSIDDLKRDLGLHLEEDVSLYDQIAEVAPSPALAEQLHEHTALAVGIDTEKARSEMIIAPVLLEVWRRYKKRIGLFSGRELNVDPARGLVGVCDFLLSLSPERLTVTAPILILCEAKNLDVIAGIPQCMAEMVAAQAFNEKRGLSLPAIHGVVSTGTNWRFLRLDGKTAWIDTTEYYLRDVGRILGVLCHAVEEAAAVAVAA